MGYEHRSDSQQMDDRNDPKANLPVLREQLRLQGMRNENARAWAEVERLREALKRYGAHTYECNIGPRQACTCGWDKFTIQRT